MLANRGLGIGPAPRTPDIVGRQVLCRISEPPLFHLGFQPLLITALCGIPERSAENRIDGPLCVRCGVDNETVILLQLGYPVLNVGRRVALSILICDASDCAKKSGSHLCNEFLLTIELVSKVGPKGTNESAFVAGAVDEFVK